MRLAPRSLAVAIALIGASCIGPPRAGSPLAEAAGRNDVAAMKKLLGGAPLRPADDPHGVLVWAARSGAADAITFLAESGVDVNERDLGRNRWTPLQHAVHTGQTAAVSVLLEQGADPDLTEAGNPTPLFMAADSVEPRLVEALLDAGADPRRPGPGGRTALTQAVSGGALWDITDRPLLGGCRPATVRALLAHDAALHVPDNVAGDSAVWWARVHDCSEVLSLIGKNPTVPGQIIVAGVGVLRGHLGVPKPKDLFRVTPSRDASSRQ
jgi:ankyrin repeat protein